MHNSINDRISIIIKTGFLVVVCSSWLLTQQRKKIDFIFILAKMKVITSASLSPEWKYTAGSRKAFELDEFYKPQPNFLYPLPQFPLTSATIST